MCSTNLKGEKKKKRENEEEEESASWTKGVTYCYYRPVMMVKIALLKKNNQLKTVSWWHLYEPHILESACNRMRNLINQLP